MSATNNAAFFGEVARPSFSEVIANLCALYGSEACAWQLLEAAYYTEMVSGPTAFVVTEMPGWVC
jgi:hypothetical protein